MTDSKRKARGTVFDLEANEERKAAIQSLEKILDAESIAKIKDSRAWAKHAQVGINDILNLAEQVSEPMAKRMILDLIPRIMAAPMEIENCLDELASATLPLALRDKKRQSGCYTGGKESGASRREERKERNEKIIKLAREFLRTRSRNDVVNILSKRSESKGLTSRQIRNILKEQNL